MKLDNLNYTDAEKTVIGAELDRIGTLNAEEIVVAFIKNAKNEALNRFYAKRIIERMFEVKIKVEDLTLAVDEATEQETSPERQALAQVLDTLREVL